MYADSKYSLTGIVEWLEGTDEAGWERQIELGEDCRSDMEQMAVRSTEVALEHVGIPS